MEAEVSHKKKSLVPKLRFKGFGDDWKAVKLGDICETFKSGESITAKDIFESGEFPVYGGNGLRGYANTFTHDGFYTLIGRQGALCGNINRVIGKSFISEHAIAVSTDKSSDTEWLAQKLDDMKLNRLSESSAQPGLAVNKLVKIKLYIPTLPEQQKIASFLSAVDEKIQQLTRKKELLEQYKKGVMQQLFSCKLRFKDDNGKAFPKWEEKRLGDVGEFKNGLNKDKNDFGFGSPFVNLMDVFGKRELNNQPFDLVNSNDNEREQYSMQKGDVLFIRSSVKRSGVGEAVVVNEDLPQTVYSGFLIRFRDDRKTLDQKFKKYCFANYSFRKELLSYATTSANTNINQESLGFVQLRVPVIEEQKKIANYLSSIDIKIESITKQITKTKSFKKGLLQQMFV